MENLKKLAGIEAAKFIRADMIVGLGTGSTAAFFVEEAARRVREEDLKITSVTTSYATKLLAESLGMKVSSFESVPYVDLTVDGVDEFDPALNGIKGGGAALLMEKIVAVNSRDIIWIADEHKQVQQLGGFPLPVEVVQFGAEKLFSKFDEVGYHPAWRVKSDGGRLITDQGNFIIDLHLGKISDAGALASELKLQVGVVEHGLFLNLAQKIILARQEGIEIFSRQD
ncbi:MAG: ribose-5-phosphate isomerase RpiA [Streptococcaceae bacterium]|jgi:ribose 5-phosphate isomerase A|nr:ribose-5-phosphate isomerase RpiA [Streptococcaceae bacterium]